jgi:hypothetical protein
MMVQTSCPSCGKSGTVPAPYLGRTVGCKKCQTLFKVRSATSFRVEAERIVIGTAAPEGEEAWFDDMPPIMVDVLAQTSANRPAPALI